MDQTGRALYLYTLDTTNARNGGCATTWPPLVGPGGRRQRRDPGQWDWRSATMARSRSPTSAIRSTTSPAIRAGSGREGIGGSFFLALRVHQEEKDDTLAVGLTRLRIAGEVESGWPK